MPIEKVNKSKCDIYMRQKILITRPMMPGDEATKHTFYWAEPIIKEAQILGYEVIDYIKNHVTYEKVSEALQTVNPNLYIHYGHGCVADLVGQSQCIITNGTKNFDICNSEYLNKYTYRMSDDIFCDTFCNSPRNVELLKDKIVIAYACHSAKRLGVCAMKNGAKAYAGFNNYLIFMVDTKNTEKIFTDCIMTFTYSLLNGDTLKMAKERTLEKFDSTIKEYKNVSYLAKLLLWDREAFTVYGDDDLTIFS